MGTISEDKDYVDLSTLPRYGKRGIEWRQAHHVPVRFRYRGVEDVLFVEKHISQDYVLISYKGIEYRLAKICLQRCALGKLFNFACANNYKYQVGDILTLPNKPSIKILEQIRQSDGHSRKGAKSYRVQCLTCQNIFNMREGNIGKGDRCPYCSNHKVKAGFNDIATTNPEMVSCFANPEDAVKYTANSNKSVLIKCPDCNTIIGKRGIDWVFRRGVSCPVCGKGRSYPNRYMFNLLSLLNENFDNETRFDWCVFPSFQDEAKQTFGVYDFVLFDHNVIIEMDSGLGHGNNIYLSGGISKEESIYRDNIKDKLALEHGFNVIRVKCDYYGSQIDFRSRIVKEAILNSEVAKILDLSNIDWVKVHTLSQSNLLKEICGLYDQGYSVKELMDKYKYAYSTIRGYLITGTQCGFCNFN